MAARTKELDKELDKELKKIEEWYAEISDLKDSESGRGKPVSDENDAASLARKSLERLNT